MEHEGRHIPNRLREYRKLNRYTQKEVSLLLGLNATNRLSRWEDGLSVPSIHNLLQLSIIYNTLIEELYGDLRMELLRDLEMRREKD